MTAFVIVDLAIDDPDRMQQYVEGVGPLIENAGGQTVVSDPGPTVLEGQWSPSAVVVHQFPDRDAAMGFWNSPGYQPWKTYRRQYSRVQVVLAAV